MLFLQFALVIIVLIGLGYYLVRRMRAKSDLTRSLNMVFLRISVPLKDSREDKERDSEQMGGNSQKEYNDVMTHFYEALHAIHSGEMINRFTGEDFFSCEYVLLEGQLQFFLVVPAHLKSLFDKQITAFYPDIFIEQVEDYNIFRQGCKSTGFYLSLSKSSMYPIRTYQFLGSDPFNNIANALSKIELDEGAAIQVMLRPMANGWQEKGRDAASELFAGKKKKKSLLKSLNVFSWVGTFFRVLVHGAENEKFGDEPDAGSRNTPMMEEQIKMMEGKNAKVGFEVVLRVVGSANSLPRANQIASEIGSAFAQYSDPNNNSFSKSKYYSKDELIKGFILRSMSKDWFQDLFNSAKKMILSSEEITSIFHFPNIKFNRTPVIKWQEFKIAGAPNNLPKEGVFLGNNIYRGETRKVHIKVDDRRRHFYIIGKSGTGKSTILQAMLKQDAATKRGICLIDPHGDLVEGILPHIPRERADDVILFDPGDMSRPMGMNILEAYTPDEKEFLSQEALAIFIKLFGEEIMGPRLQHYFRNGVLTLMDDDKEGATLIDLPRLFTDTAWQRYKSSKVKNPVVRSFWDNEMANTGQREKQEMIPYFTSKFGPFITNAQIRNIIGQTKSGFDFRKVMDEGRILLCNLSKGKLGDLNAQLLGMIMVSKLQMSAMSRVDTDEEDRLDFYMYVDEFQNFVTESFASILSEARKYRLNLIIAHQYISQITKLGGGGKGKSEDTTIRDAVFGNVGSMMCFKIGASDAEYMAKEYAPVFSEQDLVNIANYQAYIKLNIDNATSRAFSMATVYDPDKGDVQAAEAFRQLSRLKFAREKEFVEREIFRRVGTNNKKKEDKPASPASPKPGLGLSGAKPPLPGSAVPPKPTAPLSGTTPKPVTPGSTPPAPPFKPPAPAPTQPKPTQPFKAPVQPKPTPAPAPQAPGPKNPPAPAATPVPPNPQVSNLKPVPTPAASVAAPPRPATPPPSPAQAKAPSIATQKSAEKQGQKPVQKQGHGHQHSTQKKPQQSPPQARRRRNPLMPASFAASAPPLPGQIKLDESSKKKPIETKVTAPKIENPIQTPQPDQKRVPKTAVDAPKPSQSNPKKAVQVANDSIKPSQNDSRTMENQANKKPIEARVAAPKVENPAKAPQASPKKAVQTPVNTPRPVRNESKNKAVAVDSTPKIRAPQAQKNEFKPASVQKPSPASADPKPPLHDDLDDILNEGTLYHDPEG